MSVPPARTRLGVILLQGAVLLGMTLAIGGFALAAAGPAAASVGVGPVAAAATPAPDGAATPAADDAASDGTPATGTAAWAAQPCDAAGTPDGRTRFDIEADPGAPVTEHLLVTNSSTVPREFAVYGADAFNTSDGGYDLLAAGEISTDVGSWVGVDAPTVTIAALSTAVVTLNIAVPSGATPGDHPGGVVVSPVQDEVAEGGVVVDTRIAVRLAVRVSGELTPSLEVRSVSGTYHQTFVPFGSSDATVTYEVVNTGNVTVVGVPRVRLVGPFGIEVAALAPGETRQVLPGDSFQVTTELSGVEPLLLVTAIVDVEAAAAPGPDTEIPLVSSTARSGLLAVPWTGLALLVLLGLAAWYTVRRVRWRRRVAAEAWQTAVADAAVASGARDVPGTPGAPGHRPLGAGTMTMAVLLLLGVSALTSPPSAVASESSDDDGTVTLSVPAPSPTATPTSKPTATTPPRRGTGTHSAPPSPAPSAAVPTPTPTAEAPDGDSAVAAARLPDLLWNGAREPTTWGLVALGVGLAGCATALTWHLRRRAGIRRAS